MYSTRYNTPSQFTSPIISTASQSFNSIPTWKQSIIKQLNNRNEKQTNHYSEFMKIYQDLLKRERTLQDRTLIYEKEIVSLRTEKREGGGSGSGSSGSGNGGAGSGNNGRNSSTRVEELENKLFKLQEDLTNSYKRNADNASSILSLTDKNKDLQNEIISKEIENEKVRQMMKQNEDTAKRLELVIQEKEKVTNILRDELSSLHTEFLHNESKVLKLEQENSNLVERWMRKKNEEASKMNEANDFYQKMVEQRENLMSPSKSQNYTTEIENAMKDIDINNNNNMNNSGGAINNNNNSPMDSLIIMERSVEADSILPSKARKRWIGHNSEIYCISFNSVGNLMATGGGDKCVKIWDSLSGTSKANLMGASQSIMCTQFSPNDETILGTSNDNSARLWSVDLGRPRHTLTGHIGKVYSGRFISSNKVATGSHDRTIKLWDLQRGYCNRTIFCASSCNDLVTMNAGGILASGHVDHSLRFWDTNAGEATQCLTSIHEGQITSITNSPVNNNHILTSSRDHTLKIVDVRTYDVVKTYKDPEYRNGLNWTRAAWSPDGKYISAGSIDGSIYIWDVKSAKTIKVLTKVHNNGASVSCLSWNPLGNLFVSADKEKNIIQWE
ncbi:hypothetical protein CYY_008070 [Polysphondylium violaceum]|uniref:Autophagy-related protein 16 domain-containing protein n=1 Tax=Polysphondylium violaceum TaxID=133409 RepID=A0A8J4PNU9_9MYCE|nr:hypothetical protein CYY_008070 [Polysphondylium violaceum]